jgi:hypothetical protein
MLCLLSLTNIASRLLNADLRQFFLANSFYSQIDPWFIKLEVECSMTCPGYAEHPQDLYRRLVTLPRTVKSANEAARQDDRAVILYLASLTPPVLPNTYGANVAAKSGHIRTLQYLASLTPPVLPNREGVNAAAECGHLNIIKFLASLTPPVHPDSQGVASACQYDNLEMVQYLVGDLGIIPTPDGPDWAATYGRTAILQYLASVTPPVLTDEYGASSAAVNGELDTVKFLASLTPPILPHQAGVNMTADNGLSDVSEFLASLTLPILPTQD